VTSDGQNFNDFPENQLTKCRAARNSRLAFQFRRGTT